MTGPQDPRDPEGEDWGFPEVDPASPTSFEMPEPEEIVYDTGSDAWWRAQAQAQREAVEPETPPVAPSPEDPVPSPLDRDWFPPELVTPPVEPVEPVAAVEPVESPVVAPTPPVRATRPTPPPVAAPPVPAAAPAADGFPAAETVVLPEHSAQRPPHEGAPVGPARAVAGAGIALIGVLLAVGALYLFNKHDDKGSPVVASPPRATAPASVTPTAATTPTTTPTTSPTSPTSAAPSTAPSATAVPPVVPSTSPTAGIVPVSVLNNSKVKGLADQGAARFQAGGWPIRLKGNYRGGTIARTTVYFAPGGLASAERFARQFGIPRVAPRFPGLPTTGMTVVLTRDYH